MKRSSLIWMLAGLIHSGVVLADLQVNEAAAILKASKSETSLTDHEKLFVYRCDMIRNYMGFPKTPTGQATKHSCEKPEIGIAFFAGSDLGSHSPDKIGNYFKAELSKYHINAEVFIQDNWQHGSSMGFYINGESWLKEPVRPSQAVEKIETLAAEALLILYTKGRIQEWPDTTSN